jgi:hypothetical protein
LLYEIEVAAAACLELSVRMLGRAHMEAWLIGLYIHFGGYEALLRVAQDARHSLEGIEFEARQFDEWLAAEKTAARKSGKKVAKTNGGIAQWNEKNPYAPPKPLLDEPYVPQLSSTGLDLSNLIEGFGPHEAQGLSVSEIVDTERVVHGSSLSASTVSLWSSGDMPVTMPTLPLKTLVAFFVAAQLSHLIVGPKHLSVVGH